MTIALGPKEAALQGGIYNLKIKPLPESEEQPAPPSLLGCAKTSRQVGQILQNQLFTAFNPNGSGELNTGTPDFQYCEPGENETYLHAEIHPGGYAAFIHKARRTLLLFGFLCFLLFVPIRERWCHKNMYHWYSPRALPQAQVTV